MSRLLILLIRVYQVCLSGFLGGNCRFHPSCSAYWIEALRLHGTCHGVWLGVKRLARCHPWHPGGEDPVPLPGPADKQRERQVS